MYLRLTNHIFSRHGYLRKNIIRESNYRIAIDIKLKCRPDVR